MKLCRYCGKSYPELDFGIAKTTATKVYRRQSAAYVIDERKINLKMLVAVGLKYKEEKGCMRCKIHDPRVLEFHHLGKMKKRFNIADYYYHQFSVEKLKQEIAKCTVICANCHRILHAEKRNRL